MPVPKGFPKKYLSDRNTQARKGKAITPGGIPRKDGFSPPILGGNLDIGSRGAKTHDEVLKQVPYRYGRYSGGRTKPPLTVGANAVRRTRKGRKFDESNYEGTSTMTRNKKKVTTKPARKSERKKYK